MEGLSLYSNNQVISNYTESNFEEQSFSFLNQLEKYGVIKNREVVPTRTLISEYREFISRNRSKSYLRSVCGSMNLLENYFGTHYSINNITHRTAEKFIYHLMDRIPKGYRVHFRNVKALFSRAVGWGYVSENPFAKMKLPKLQRLKPKYINELDLEKICMQVESQVLKDAIGFSFYTGLRLSEMVNLKWVNVDLKNIVITIGDDNFITKSRKSRTIPINKKALEILTARAEYERKSMFVFGNDKGFRYTGDWYSRYFKRAVKKCGMSSEIHWHSLRHSFASNLVQKGASIYAIKELMGHSSISVTEIYSHTNIEMLREAVGCLG